MESLGDHFSLYKCFLYFVILSPFIFVISMFDICEVPEELLTFPCSPLESQ
jgi:hypothetical protein